MILRWSIKDIIEVIEGCVLNKFDCIIAAEGKRGTGKSTLLYKIADRLGNRGIVKFYPETSIVYSREDTTNLLAHKEKFVIFSDEMINVSYKRDFYEEGQKTLIKGLNMYRDSCNVFMQAVPLFKDLDGDMRQLCKIKLSVVRRGLAYIYIQPNFEDILQFEVNKRKNKFKKLHIKLEPTKRVGMVLFDDITPTQRRTYEEIKRRKRGQVYGNEDKILSPLDDFYNKLYNKVIAKELSSESFEALASISGKSITNVRNRIGQMLRDNKKEVLNSYLKKPIKASNNSNSKWD